MRVYQVQDLEDGLKTPMVVCLGVFDGVHLGHLRLINAAIELAKKSGYETLVHTYSPEPFYVLYPFQRQMELTNLQERLRLFEKSGVQHVAVSRFTKEMQHESGEQFFYEILLGKLNAKSIVVGFNHRFGYRGDTDVEKLGRLCEQNKIGLQVIAPVKTGSGELISSTAIRNALSKKDYALAEEMLGRPVDEKLMEHFAQCDQQ
ncbi:MAG: FAD synthetase family protein [Bacillota bacterium]|nr:FAD synthetase family protein [Bacillota bacterium]